MTILNIVYVEEMPCNKAVWYYFRRKKSTIYITCIHSIYMLSVYYMFENFYLWSSDILGISIKDILCI